jgi:hypothetical protein
MAPQRSSTRIKAVSSPARNSPGFCRLMEFRSAWMEPDGGGTMSLSSGCGGVIKYEEVYLHADETVRDAQDGVARYMTSGIRSGRIARVTDTRPIACTVTTGLHGPLPRRYQRPGVTYERKDSVQTSEAASDRILRPIATTKGFTKNHFGFRKQPCLSERPTQTQALNRLKL